MNIELINFGDWYQQYHEGGAMRRAKRDAFIRGTMPPLAPANVHSGGTGHPFAVVVASRVKTHADKEDSEDGEDKKDKKSKKKKKS